MQITVEKDKSRCRILKHNNIETHVSMFLCHVSGHCCRLMLHLLPSSHLQLQVPNDSSVLSLSVEHALPEAAKVSSNVEILFVRAVFFPSCKAALSPLKVNASDAKKEIRQLLFGIHLIMPPCHISSSQVTQDEQSGVILF